VPPDDDPSENLRTNPTGPMKKNKNNFSLQKLALHSPLNMKEAMIKWQ